MEEERTARKPPEEGDGADAQRIRQERLRRFRGPLQQRDAEVIEYWRKASPEEHAHAMIVLAQTAEMIVARTGLNKDPEDMFPGFPPLRTERPVGEHRSGRRRA